MVKVIVVSVLCLSTFTAPCGDSTCDKNKKQKQERSNGSYSDQQKQTRPPSMRFKNFLFHFLMP